MIGVDEVGRGCLAGPVYAGAVIIDPSKPFKQYRDSKILSEGRREELFSHIIAHHRWGIGFATVEEIDRLNILQASFLAMKRALIELGVRTGRVLVDGNKPIPGLGSHFTQIPVVEGDAKIKPISAASIVAKVVRDRLMREWHGKFPQYAWADNKGYGTKEHCEAISRFGPTPMHRKSFKGVAEFVRPNPQGRLF